MAARPPTTEVELLSTNKMFGGHNLRYRHQSATLGCPMTFSVYLPPSPASNVPVSATPLLPASPGSNLSLRM